VFTTVIVTLIAAIGISRLLLGIAWLGITAFAFELSRQAAGEAVTDPVTEGLEPEARADLQPAEPEMTMHHDRARTYGRIAAGVLVSWVLILGALTGIGKLIMITRNGNGNLLGDHTIPHWFAAHRTAATTCLYVGIAILVIGHARGWWRYLFLIPAIVMPVAVAVSQSAAPADRWAPAPQGSRPQRGNRVRSRPAARSCLRAAISPHSTDWDYTNAAVH
jgi:hypothetical protein